MTVKFSVYETRSDRCFFMSMLLSCFPASVRAGTGPADWAADERVIRAILFLTGAPDIETLSEEELEKWWDLAESPLQINLVPPSVIEKSGLMSMYQAASFAHYRAHSGDVLSYSELASIDGFGERVAEALAPFISLESSALPGRSSDLRRRPRNSLSVNVSEKTSLADGKADAGWGWNSRYRIEANGRYDAGMAVRRGYDDRWVWPTSVAGYYMVYGRKSPWKMAIGDYALRFGQGLALWNGFSMTGVQNVQSFWKRPAGLSPSRALSPSLRLRGIAAEVDIGKFVLTVFSASGWLAEQDFSGASGKNRGWDVLSGGNVAWRSSHGQVSATAFCKIGKMPAKTTGNGFAIGKSAFLSLSKVSVDARFCLKGAELFAEAAYDICAVKPALTGGAMIPVVDNWNLAFSLRYIPDGYDMAFCAPVRTWSGKKGEVGASSGVSFRKMGLTVDFGMRPDGGDRQWKALLYVPCKAGDNVSMVFRLQERLRNYGLKNRTDFRGDLNWKYGLCGTAFRLNVLKGRKMAGLLYVEEAYYGRIGAVFLRGTAFIADNWDDRIYCYERDAPGSFNVPAYYGRGYALSLVARMKWRFRRSAFKSYLRAGWSSTPWSDPGMKNFRQSKAEVRVQLMYDF